MDFVYIRDIAGHEGAEAVLRGWVYNKRSSGKIHFILLRDGTGVIQCVASKGGLTPEQFAELDRLTQESSVEIRGRVRRDQRAPGGYELDVTAFKIVQIAENYPITPKEHGTAFLMENRHLWLRSSRQHAVMKIRHEIIKACRDYFDDQGFTLVDTPIFTPNACEGTTTLFETEYFEQKAYLTQSGQLYNEATAAAHGKVYCFGPTFRAEKSKTRRHLMEFWMIEPEVAFATLRCTRKFENLSFEPRVALLLDDRANQPADLLQAATLTVLGRSHEIEGSDRDRWTTALLSKHATLGDFFRSLDCAVVVIEVDRLLLVTEFQRVIELVVRGGVLERVTPEAR